MRTNTEYLRHQVIALGRRTRGARFPGALKAAIIGHARHRRQQGEGVRRIARSLGVSPESIRRWTTSRMTSKSTRRALVPIVVRRERDDIVVDSVTVSAPGGYRVEGLTVAAAADLLRRLA